MDRKHHGERHTEPINQEEITEEVGDVVDVVDEFYDANHVMIDDGTGGYHCEADVGKLVVGRAMVARQ